MIASFKNNLVISKSGEYVTKYTTPLGNLKQIHSVGGGLGSHITEYPIKSIDDIKIMKYKLESTEIFFMKDNFDKAEELFGDSCVTSDYITRPPFQKFVTQYMGFTRTITFFKRYPNQMEDFVQFLEEYDNHMYDQIANSPLKIVNFGDNIDGNLSTPPYFEKYHIPHYNKRVKQLHQAGKICHIHIDGSLRNLLPYLEDLPFDRLEALTAKPQGDDTLEEMKDSIGDKVLLDGVPSFLFLPQYSNKYVREYTQKVLDLFSPNLILGVSDELSPNGDIRKIEMISEIVQKYEPS